MKVGEILGQLKIAETILQNCGDVITDDDEFDVPYANVRNSEQLVTEAIMYLRKHHKEEEV